MSFLKALRVSLALTQGVSHAASCAMLGENINEDFNLDYDRMTVMGFCALLGSTLGALSAWFSEGKEVKKELCGITSKLSKVPSVEKGCFFLRFN